jgi:predicted kinase
MKVVMLRGLPGSGKTTWALEWLANNPDWRRVNKDDLRRMLWGSKKPKNNERHLDLIQEGIIVELLASGFNVIVDNTHLSPKRELHLRALCAKYEPHNNKEVEFEVKFFDTPLFECILNDARRPDPVGYKVIGRMYEQFLKPAPIPYDEDLPDAYIVDIDGTVAINNNRSPFDYDKIHTDAYNLDVIRVIAPRAEQVDKIIFVSGRPEKYREATMKWLGKIGYSGFFSPLLYMRADGDNRADHIVKRELYDAHIKGKYNILGVFDDRTQVVDGCWRPLGLTVFQVASGYF